MSIRVGFDVDGILADFNTPYIDLIEKYSGVRLPPPSDTYPDKWDCEADAGMEKSRTSEMWREIKASPTFWLDVPAYANTRTFLDWLTVFTDAKDVEIYFITNRMGVHVKEQTEFWLMDNGFPTPTVLISGEKGLCARALSLTLYIDDKNENCTDVRDNSPLTEVFMLKRPYNSPQENVPVVDSLNGFATIIEEVISNG